MYAFYLIGAVSQLIYPLLFLFVYIFQYVICLYSSSMRKKPCILPLTVFLRARVHKTTPVS